MKISTGWTVCAMALVLASGCGNGEKTSSTRKTKPVAPVEVAEAVVHDLDRRVVYTGSIEPVRVARMASPAEGPIVMCGVREGDQVSPGQRLVLVGRSQMAESGLEAAREELKRQTEDLASVEQLVKSGSLPSEQLEISRAAQKRAEAQVAAAETGAADYEIRAPWAGVVAKVWVSEGNYVAPRTSLVEIYDPASLLVRFAVPEQEMRRLKTGMPLVLTLDAWPGREFRGTIERIYPQLDAATRTVTVEAGLNTDVALLSGMFARVEVPVETVSAAVVIPSGALMTLPNGAAVAFVAQDGKAVRRPVKTGLESAGLVQIVDGVSPGEQIIVRGQEHLKDGAAINVIGAKGVAAAGQDATARGAEEGRQ